MTIFALVVATSLAAAQGTAVCTSTMMEANAKAFFNACETGKGWNGTAMYVKADTTTFEAQVMNTPALEKIHVIKDYVEWMVSIVKEMGPKATFKVRAGAFDAERNSASYYGVFAGSIDYVYYLHFDDTTCKIDDMVKIWNDCYSHPSCRNKTIAA